MDFFSCPVEGQIWSWEGCCSLPSPASAPLGASAGWQQHLEGESTRPTLARRLTASGWGAAGPKSQDPEGGPSSGFQQSPAGLLSVPGSSMPRLCLLGLQTQFSTQICSFTFCFGVWGESQVL